MNKVIILGCNGGIGSELVDVFINNDYAVYPVNKNTIDLKFKNSKQKLNQLLKETDPDIIINATGLFGNNKIDFNNIFNINVRSNWNIINYYKHNPNKIVKFIMLGSSSYNGPRKNYILYTATKCALHSIFESTKELFQDTNLKIGIVHPKRTKTKMLSSIKKDDLNPEYVAEEIFNFVKNMDKSSYKIIE